MTPERFRELIAITGLGEEGLINALDVDPRRYERWWAGKRPIPEPVAAWLETLAGGHVADPPNMRGAPRDA